MHCSSLFVLVVILAFTSQVTANLGQVITTVTQVQCKTDNQPVDAPCTKADECCSGSCIAGGSQLNPTKVCDVSGVGKQCFLTNECSGGGITTKCIGATTTPVPQPGTCQNVAAIACLKFNASCSAFAGTQCCSGTCSLATSYCSCTPNGRACSIQETIPFSNFFVNSQCCSGFCNPSSLCACRSIGGSCRTGVDCCSQKCNDGLCTCGYGGAECANDADCCFSGTCTNGQCSLQQPHTLCDSNSNCDTGSCTYGTCDCYQSSTSTTCLVDADPATCCSGTVCRSKTGDNNGVCTCMTTGAKNCVKNSDCCSGRCKPPYDNHPETYCDCSYGRESCLDANDCCELTGYTPDSCQHLVTRNPAGACKCSVKGGGCLKDSNCCSGKCNCISHDSNGACTFGICACSQPNEICRDADPNYDGQDCCAGNTCTGGRCACIPTGQTAASADKCCSGAFYDSTTTCKCKPYYAQCVENNDCCSGKCDPQYGICMCRTYGESCYSWEQNNQVIIGPVAGDCCSGVCSSTAGSSYGTCTKGGVGSL